MAPHSVRRPRSLTVRSDLFMFRPAIKRTHSPFVMHDGRIRLGMEQYGIASEIVDDESRAIERLLELMDGTRPVRAISAELRASHPDWEPADVRGVIDQLTDAGHVEDLGAPLPEGLSE